MISQSISWHSPKLTMSQEVVAMFAALWGKRTRGGRPAGGQVFDRGHEVRAFDFGDAALAAGLAKQRGIYKGRKKGTKKLKPEEIRSLRKNLSAAQIAKLKNVTPHTVYNVLEETN